jgi:hypothetical protein
MRVYRRLRSAEFFLMAKQAALDTSWMNLDAEAFLYPFHLSYAHLRLAA